MSKLTTDQLLEAVSEMTVLELSEFVKAFEEKLALAPPLQSPSPQPQPPVAPQQVAMPPLVATPSRPSFRTSARTRSRSSRWCASSPASASRRRRTWWTPLQSRSRRGSPRLTPRRSSPLSPRLALRSRSSNNSANTPRPSLGRGERHPLPGGGQGCPACQVRLWGLVSPFAFGRPLNSVHIAERPGSTKEPPHADSHRR